MTEKNYVFVAGAAEFYKVVNPSLVITSATQELTAPDVIRYGAIGLDGPSHAPSVSSEAIRQFNNRAAVRYRVTDASEELTITLLEDTPDVRELAFGSQEVDGIIERKIANLVQGRWIVDYFDDAFQGTEDGSPAVAVKRFEYTNATVTSLPEWSGESGSERGYTFTLTATPDPLTRSTGRVLSAVLDYSA